MIISISENVSEGLQEYKLFGDKVPYWSKLFYE